MVISSRNNTRIKELRSLRARKNRERTGLFFVEGIRLVAEAAQTGALIEEIVVAPELLRSALGWEIVQEQRETGTPCHEVTAELFETLAIKNRAQGIGAAVRQRWESLEEVQLVDERGWVGVEAIQDPGNLGTILRTNAAVGGAGAILIGPTTDPYDPTAVRATLGAIFTQRLVRTTLAEFAAWKERHRYLVVGTSPGAPIDYRTVTYQPPIVLLMGSERRGLSPELHAICDMCLRIPMVGRCDSLNVAVATSLVLYEMFSQQSGEPAPRRDLSSRV